MGGLVALKLSISSSSRLVRVRRQQTSALRSPLMVAVSAFARSFWALGRVRGLPDCRERQLCAYSPAAHPLIPEEPQPRHLHPEMVEAVTDEFYGALAAADLEAGEDEKRARRNRGGGGGWNVRKRERACQFRGWT